MSELYGKFAEEFALSRQYFEPGWEYLNKLTFRENVRILDLGCGSGRFIHFADSKLPLAHFEYTGVDGSSNLLGSTEEYALQANKLKRFKTINRDLISEIDELEVELKGEQFDLVLLYAVVHHIPKFENRLKLIKFAANKLAKDGHLHISFWQFGEYSRYRKKVGFHPSLVGLAEADMEENDYVMNWKRGGETYRFCHWTKKEEIELINKELLKMGLTKVTDYREDGKEHEQNWYWLWTKK